MSKVSNTNLTWSRNAIAMTHVSNGVGLIQGYPKFHLFSKSLKQQLCIVFEFLNYGLIFPPSNVLKGLREVPVVNSYLKIETSHSDRYHYLF